MSGTINLDNIEVIDDALAAVLRAKTVAQRIEMVADANETARTLAKAGVQLLHPTWSIVEVRREVGRRMLRATS